MSISVVMTTYNGEKFVCEQLESIKNQSISPDEVLIFDDGSKDSTIELIENYIAENDLNWEVIKNEVNLGWQKNFMQGIKKANGDLIFLADQDDIWHNNKVEIMSYIMKNKSEMNVLTSNYKRVDQGFHIDKDEINVDRNSGLHNVYKIQLSPKTSNNSYPGCTFCLRKTFFDLISPAWSERYPHDALIYLAGWMSESLYCVEYELHYFRRHESSASLKGPDFDVETRFSRIKRTEYAYLELRKILFDEPGLPSDRKKIIDNYGKWLEMRLELIGGGRRYYWIVLATKYKNYYPSTRTLFGDLLTSMRLKKLK